ncbi:unnamed protein product [Rhizophagus irregularis]|nr:unnamed protein product [Rhizophagus irregularis]
MRYPEGDTVTWYKEVRPPNIPILLEIRGPRQLALKILRKNFSKIFASFCMFVKSTNCLQHKFVRFSQFPPPVAQWDLFTFIKIKILRVFIFIDSSFNKNIMIR